MKKTIRKIILTLFIFVMFFYITGCKKNYQITYHLEGGILNYLITEFSSDDNIELPNPEKNGYRFIGWYDNNQYSGKPITNIVGSIKKDITLYAKWEEIIKYQITFDENGGTNIDDLLLEEGQQINLPIPTKEGFKFKGWFLNDHLLVDTTTIKDNITLVAKWEKAYQIKFLNTDLEPIIFTESEEVVLPNLEIEGYFFGGWFENYQYNGEPIKKIEKGTKTNLIFVPLLEKIYKINYNFDDAQMPEKYNEFYFFEKEDQLPTPTKLGYSFIGWSERPNNTSNLLFNIPISYEEDITLYANWKKTIYNVTYNFGDNIYVNHKQLYIAFFSDFYYYIKDYKKAESSLIATGANSLDDFLNICSTWTGGSAGMSEIGNKYSRFYLRLDTGGKLEEQTSDDGFIGYCLENNMYTEFVYFIAEFFAAWRKDEGYTGGRDDPNGTGSDFLASPWASLVDTAKFFYFEKSTLPKYFFDEGDTVPYFYDKIPYVIQSDAELVYQYDWEKGLDLLETITLEGYHFEGWYDNKEFNGQPITKLEKNIYHDITIYAKIVKNEK